MKENSIEKTLENIQNVDLITLLRKFKKEGVENFIVIRRNDYDEILSDYKRVLKENEQKNKMIDLMAEDIYGSQIECNRYFRDKEEVKASFLLGCLESEK